MILRRLPLVVSFSVLAFPARAHDALDGAGLFVNGILHPVVEPAHLLAFLALGLWIGRQDRDALRRAVIAFAVALIAGLLAGPLAALPPAVPIALALILGGLAAGGWPAPARVVAMVALASAALISFDSAADDWGLALGIWAGAMLIVLNVVNITMRIEAAWLHIAIRIAGAWIAAIALLLLALSLRA